MTTVPAGEQGKLKYLLAASSAAILWGFMAIPLRNIQQWGATDILYYRILISTLCIWVFIIIFRKKQLRLDIQHYAQLLPAHKKRMVRVIVISTLLILGNWFSFIYVVNNISIQVAAFAYLVCPLLTTLAAFFILREPLSAIKKVSLVIALLSVTLLATGTLIDVVWSVGVASLYALYLIGQRMTGQFDKLNVLAVQLVIASIIILPFMIWQHHPIPTQAIFWTNVTVISIVFTIIPLYLSLYALIGISSSTVGVLIYVNPIVAFAVAYYVFDEQITVHQLIAYSILVFAIILFNSNTLRRWVRAPRPPRIT